MSKIDTAEVQKQIRDIKVEISLLKMAEKHDEAKVLDRKRRILENTLHQV